MKCLYTNAQSLVNKHFELQAVVDIYDPDIIGITETWLNSKISDNEYCIEGYHKPIRQDRVDTKDGRGGGVLLLIKNSINYVQIVPDNSIDYTNSVWIEVVNNDGKKTVIGVVYRSPNSTETNNEKLYKCIQELSNRNLIIMGDFNYPNIDWNNLHTTRDGLDFMNLIMDNFLCQHVNFPTRENNILDLFISSDPNMVDNLQCVGKLGSSDHVLVLAELNFKTCVAENLQEIPDWKKANMDRIKDSLNLIMDNFLCQHVNFPTRENNILDLFISSDPNMVDNLQCVGKLGSSDHVLVLAELNFKTCIAENLQEIPDWKKANMDRIKDSLNIDWKQKLEGKDTFSSWNEFKTLLNNSININVPMKKRRTKTNKKIWITREIVRQIRKKKHLYRNYRLTREPQTYNRYKEVEAHVKQLIKDSVQRFEQKLGDNIKHDSKSFYKYVKSKQQVKDSIGPLKGQNGEVSSDSKFMAEELNAFFASSFTRENTENISSSNVKFKGDSEEKLTDINITPELVRKHLLKLKRYKSPGPDNIGSSLLLDICDYISEPLSLIFNMSIHLKQVPTDWKHANVTPIFKKGDKSDPGNYRPISLTSQICKVLESILRDNIVNHLNTHTLLLKSQHGFTKGKSCLTNLLSFLEDVTKAIDDLVGWLVLLLYVPSQQLWSLRDGQFT